MWFSRVSWNNCASTGIEMAPIRLAEPAPAPATVSVTAKGRGSVRPPTGAYKAEQEDQYDIPAFLRRGGQAKDA